MSILTDQENIMDKENIEKEKKIVDKLYKKEKEDREKYLKSTEEQRLQSFQESKENISKTIGEKSYLIERKREQDEKIAQIEANQSLNDHEKYKINYVFKKVRELENEDKLSDVDRKKIELAEPIRQLGSYEVTVRLSKDMIPKIKVNVVGEEAG